MLVSLFLTSLTLSNTLQFQYFSLVSSSNPKRSNPRTLKIIKIPQVSLSPLNAIVPTAPRTRSPPPLQPHEVIISHPTSEKQVERAERALTDKESGVRGRKALKRIIRNIEKLQENGRPENSQKGFEPFELRVCFEKLGGNGGGGEEFGGKMPWWKEERVVLGRMKKEKAERRADMVLEEGLLERLRVQARKMRKWVKVMKAGVTNDVVYHIRLAWRKNDLCRNREREKEIVELKTGGLVVWSRKNFLVIYRGSDYQSTSKSL